MLPLRKTIALALTLGAALAACASPATPGVKVRSVATDIGLGLFQPGVETPEPVDFGDLPEFIPRPPFEPQLPPPFEACPSAGLFDFPIAATPAVRDGAEPREGIYRWVHDVEILDEEIARQFLPPTTPIEETSFRFFGSRTVRGLVRDAGEQAVDVNTGNLNRDSGGVVPHEQGRGSFQFTEDIRPGLLPNANTLSRSDIFRVQPSSYLDTEQSTGDAGEGVLDILSGWVEVDESSEFGFNSWLMVYTPPPLLIEFPIAPGERVRWATGGQPVNAALLGLVPSTGLPDPTQIDLEALSKLGASAFGPKYTFEYEGLVSGRKNIDACGDMVQGWLVEGILTIHVGRSSNEVASAAGSPDPSAIDAEGETTERVFRMAYDYAIATQFGGLIVYERFAYPAPESAIRLRRLDEEVRPETKPVFQVEAFIGQEIPDPLPGLEP